MKTKIRISKQLLSMLICFAMVLAVLPMTAFAAAMGVAEEHKHPLNDGADVVWSAITSIGTSLGRGNYYLQSDVKCSNITVSGTVNLCLNGHSLTSKDATPKKITINQGATLNICDCAETGSSALVIDNKGTLNIYGGTYGGQYIVNGRTYYNELINNAGTLHIYDAHVDADIELINNTGTLTIDDGTFSDASVWTNVWCVDNAGGTAVINGGSFTSSSSHTIYSNGGSAASLTIDGGTFSNASNSGFALYVTHGKCTINDGTFNACSQATILASAGSNCEVEINGGSFASSAGNNIVSYSSTKDTVTISGGTFTTENGIAMVTASDGGVSGGRFVGGISMYNLAAKLQDGHAFYQNGAKVDVSNNGRPLSRIEGGDVTVEAVPVKAKVTGVVVLLNGLQQPEGEILFGDSDEITIVYQGENFDKLDSNYKYQIGNSSGTIGIYGFFTVNTQTTPHTASKTIKLTSLSKQQTNIIAYTNAGEAQTVTGYTLKYSTPPAEAKITGAVVLLNGTEQEVGEVIFTDGDEITVIYQGENFDQLKNQYQYKIGPAGGTIAAYGHFTIDTASAPHTASRTFDSITLQAAKQSSITYTKTGESETDTGYTLTYQKKIIPVTVTGTDAAIIYNGSTYDVSAMFAIDPAECDGEKTYSIVDGGTGEGTLSGSELTITKAGTFVIQLDVAESGTYSAATGTATLTVNKGEAAIPAGLTAYYGQKLSEIELLDGWSWQNANAEVGNAGDNTHLADYEGNDLYAEKQDVELTVTVSQADTQLDVQGESDYYYGENIELTVKVTAVKPAVSLFSLRAAPAPGTVSVWNGEEMLFEQEADNGDTVNVTIGTVENGLIPGSYTLDVKYTASDNMGEATASKAVTVRFLSDAPDALLPEANENGWYNADPTLTAPEGWTISEALDSGYGSSITPATTDGENAITYYLRSEDGPIAEKTVTVNVDKTAPVITSASGQTTDTTAKYAIVAEDATSGVHSYEMVMTSGEGTPTIVNNNDGTFNVSGLLSGKRCTFQITVTDKAGNSTVIASTVETTFGPYITFPTEETEVHVFVGQKAEMKITAQNAYRYEWYMSVDGGTTFLRIPDANTPEYAIEYALMKDNGNLYFCRAYGESGVLYADSPVFKLRVEETLPQTGDDTPIAWLIGLCLMSLTAMLFISRKRVKE